MEAAGPRGQYDKVDPAVDLAAAVKADIEQMKTAEGGAANEAMAFMENMEQRVEQAPADSKAVYEQIYAKAKELNELAESGEPKISWMPWLLNWRSSQANSNAAKQTFVTSTHRERSAACDCDAERPLFNCPR